MTSTGRCVTCSGTAILELPPGVVPTASAPPLFVAMSDKAVGVAAGADQAAALETYLRAPPAGQAVFLRMYFSGKFYGLLAQSFDKLGSVMPAEQRARIEQQKKMFALYEQALRAVELTLTATPSGIALHETIEQNP